VQKTGSENEAAAPSLAETQCLQNAPKNKNVDDRSKNGRMTYLTKIREKSQDFLEKIWGFFR
jgi:hypothetical protein